jgi:hypothetical protein
MEEDVTNTNVGIVPELLCRNTEKSMSHAAQVFYDLHILFLHYQHHRLIYLCF